MRLRKIALGLGLFYLSCAPATAGPQLRLENGSIEGYMSENAPGAVFKGIPFARPPVGDLRWRAPQPLEPWDGVKQAIEFGPDCAQLGTRAPGNEDCLYLNIWTPEWPVEGKYPVMLYLFGGANAVNSANNPLFDGAALAQRGVVVVTTNYRVGIMGFLAHPALSDESGLGSSGNYALLDQLMALRWLQDNIAQFGGDPGNVTLFGQSSGSFDLLLLMTSPLSDGLFHKAIAQAGQILSFGGTMTKAYAESLGEKVAADLSVPEHATRQEQLAYLRNLPVEDIMRAAAAYWVTGLESDTGLLTNIDGWVLPELPARVFAEGRQMPIPLIVGNNAREIPMDIEPNALRQKIREQYGDLAPQALQAYGLADGGEGYVDPLLGGPGPQWMTDNVQRCARMLEAQWHSGVGNFVWQYQFERSIPGLDTRGAFHGAEVPFVFGTLDRFESGQAQFSEADWRASAQMQQYWVNFAKTGNPNGSSLPEWPRADASDYMAFTQQGPVGKPDPRRAACQLFRQWTLQRLVD